LGCDAYHSTKAWAADIVQAIMKNIPVRDGSRVREQLLAKGRRALRRSAVLVQMLDLVLEAGDRPEVDESPAVEAKILPH